MGDATREVDRSKPDGTQVTVRPAHPDDTEAVAGILNPIIDTRTYTALDTPFSVEAERQFIRDFPSRGIFHVAVAGTQRPIVGFQDVEPFADYTRAFDHVGVIGTYVDLARRRQGIASQLFAFVRADNRPALCPYLRHGFSVIGTARRHARIDGRFIDEILIERQLT